MLIITSFIIFQKLLHVYELLLFSTLRSYLKMFCNYEIQIYKYYLYLIEGSDFLN